MNPVFNGPKVPFLKTLRWLVCFLLVAVFFAAASGVFVKSSVDIPPIWSVFSWLMAFGWLFFLVRIRAFASTYALGFLFGTTIGLDLLVQTTGVQQSPLLLSLFLLMGIAAWDGKAIYGFIVATLFCALDAISLRKEYAAQNVELYLKWAAFLVTAFFLTRIVNTRKEKEQLDQRLSSLTTEAKRLQATSEPKSFHNSKDVVFGEERRHSVRIGSVMEMEEVLERQLDFIRRTLGLYTAAFFLNIDVENKRALRLRAFSTGSDVVASDQVIFWGETLVGLCAQTKKRIVLDPLPAESAKVLPYYSKPLQIKSFLAEPVFLKRDYLDEETAEELLGILVLDHIGQGSFNVQNQEIIGQFIQVLSESICNIRVLHFAKTKTRDLHALYELSNSFSTLLETEQILDVALRTAVEISVCDTAYLSIFEPKQERFFNRKSWSKTDPGHPAEIEEDFAAWMIQNKKPIRYMSGQSQGSGEVNSRRTGILGSTKSFLMVPLLAGPQLFGVIRLNRKAPLPFLDYDQDILTTLANQTAMALKNSNMVEQIKAMAIRDGLTGLYNHRHFQEKLESEIDLAESRNKDVCLILIDVDHFKKFNDNYGHQEGDRVLRVVAEILQEIVNHEQDMAARYGGEEFVIVLSQTDIQRGINVAENIRKAIEGKVLKTTQNHIYRITASFGVAAYPFDAREPKTLIQRADEALYLAKKNGRNCVKKFEKIN